MSTGLIQEAAAAPEMPNRDAAILAALRDLTGGFAKLQERVEKMETAAPQFRPMARPEPPQRRNLGGVMKGMAKGEARDGGMQMPVDARGLPLQVRGQWLTAPPRYRKGDTVAINRSALREGLGDVTYEWVKGFDTRSGVEKNERIAHVEPVSLGQKYDRLPPYVCQSEVEPGYVCGTSTPVGTVCTRCSSGPVIRETPRKTDLGWKYRVYVPGLPSAPRGDGFHEYELLYPNEPQPAYGAAPSTAEREAVPA